jgi:hypothetical protein
MASAEYYCVFYLLLKDTASTPTATRGSFFALAACNDVQLLRDLFAATVTSFIFTNLSALD